MRRRVAAACPPRAASTARRPPSHLPAVAPATFVRKALRLGIVFLLLTRGASPLGLPDTLSRAPQRRRAPFAWLARTLARGAVGGFAPRTPRHALSRPATP